MFYKYLLTIVLGLLCVVGFLVADQKLCNELKPCGDRGVCGRSSDFFSKKLLTISCYCRDNYTGQWCQYVDDKYQPGPKGKVPGKPTITTNTNVPNYNSKYTLKFRGVKNPPKGRVLYYLLRYTTSQGAWRSTSIAVNRKSANHKVVLDTLDWGHVYKLELHAGNMYGLGKPDRRTLKLPKVSEPRIVEVSEDLVGSKAVCCDKPLILHCKAEGTPQPTYSWHFEGQPLLNTNDNGVVQTGGSLTIAKPSGNIHQGEYRCLAGNAWGKVLSRPIEVKILAPGKSVTTEVKPAKKRSFTHVTAPNQIMYQATNLSMNCGKRMKTDRVEWFYNGVALKKPGLGKDDIGMIEVDGRVTDIRYKLNQGRFEVVEAKPRATGIYQCDVATKNGLVTMTQYVHVRDFDHIESLTLHHKTSDEVRLKEGSSATLTCLPSPVSSITWTNLPNKKAERFRKLPNGSLEIRGVIKSDSNSRITCESLSDYGVSVRRLVRIHVAQSVDGGWSSWGPWKRCRRKKCLKKTRFRQCNNPAPRYDGTWCPGHMADYKLSGVWSSWTAWVCAPISGKCGKHKKFRTRTCEGICTGKGKQRKKCSRYIPCPVDGAWSKWSSWSACSKTCLPGGIRKKSRVRLCSPPKHGGKMCKGKSKETKTCKSDSRPCPINGGWAIWSAWTKCSTTCNAGIISRVRKCTNPVPQHGGQNCEGTKTGTKKCTNTPCKVDGGWSAWSDFSACSVSCGAGVKYSTRMCNNPREEHGGKECEGNSQYRTQCDVPPCAVDGGWSVWSAWGECSTPCNDGIVSRVRNCTNPAPQHGGQECDGESEDEDSCNIRPCEVNGGWSSWSKWSPCTVTCDSGVKARTRSCSNPVPKHGGKKCHGKRKFEAKCHKESCEGLEGEEEEISDVKKIRKKSSGKNINVILFTAAGGCGALLLIALLFCCLRASYIRSLTKDYMPLTRIKTQPVIKSILKSTKRSSKTPEGSDLPSKSTKRGSISSGGSEVPSENAKRSGSASLPPPPPPISDRTASRKKRRPGAKTRQPTSTRKDTDSTKDDATSLEKAASESVKTKGILVHKIAKESEPPSPSVSSFSPKDPTAVSSDNIGLEKAVSQSGKVKDVKLHKSAKDFGSPTVSQGSLKGPKEADPAKVKKTKDTEGQKVPPFKKDSSASSITKEPPESPSTPPGASEVVESSKSGMGSQSIYGGLIGFENAILETEDDQVDVKKAMIENIKSKSKPKKSEN